MLRVVLGLAGLCPSGPAHAQEALFLRIRPRPDPAALGTAGGAEAALAAREAIWERSNARARTIIESVCTGCLRPWDTPAPRLVTAAANPAAMPPAAASSSGGQAPALAVATIPDPLGVESDPPLGASEPTSDPSFPERRP
ncbi:hypothetical protein [Methylobacterium aerolatum]|uniref:Uncharacterized protein n=1 Tax=Methylobacterium aerolatum TaxID=418708 RepID=A0ABU0HW61_9HYPH|nr:hypothetical protein [Methylobacterium aerolatum]MDQ0445945.1 hypothetical protein [Methylobacterium aerolatum]